MKRKRFKLLACAVLALAMFVTLLSACNSATPSPSPSESVKPQESVGKSEEPTTFSVTFNGNGGTGEIAAITNVKSGDNVTLPRNVFTRSGYTFLSWWINGTEYKAGDSITISGDTVVYAYWQKNSSGGGGGGGGSSGGSSSGGGSGGSGGSTQLSAPSVEIENGKVVWSSVSNAQSYTISIGGRETANVTSPFALNVVGTDITEIKVKAIGNGSSTTDSAYSSSVYAINTFKSGENLVGGEKIYVLGNAKVGGDVKLTSTNAKVELLKGNATAKINVGGTLTINMPNTTFTQNVPIEAANMDVTVSQNTFVCLETITLTGVMTVNQGTFEQKSTITGSVVLSGDNVVFNIDSVVQTAPAITVEKARSVNVKTTANVSITSKATAEFKVSVDCENANVDLSADATTVKMPTVEITASAKNATLTNSTEIKITVENQAAGITIVGKIDITDSTRKLVEISGLSAVDRAETKDKAVEIVGTAKYIIDGEESSLPSDITIENFVGELSGDTLVGDNLAVKVTATVSGETDNYIIKYPDDLTVNVSHVYNYRHNTLYHWQICTVCSDTPSSGMSTHTYNADSKCDICEKQCTSGLEYELNADETGYIVKSLGSATETTDLVIPSSYNGKPVVGIADSAFSPYIINVGYKPNKIKTVEIPESVKSIEQAAFICCKDLETLVIPSSVEKLDGASFLKVISEDASEATLISVKLSSNNQNYMQDSFGAILSKDGKTLVYAPDAESYTIPSSVTSIGDYACCFRRLTNITIPEGVTEIGQAAFNSCSNLAEVTWNATSCNDLTAYPFDMFSVKKVTIGNNVKRIPAWAFQNARNLTSITIPDSVTEIGEMAFSDCYRLAEVYNLSSLNITAGGYDNGQVGRYALDVYNDKNAESKLSNDNGFVIHTNGDVKTLVGYQGTETDVTIPSSVTKIGFAAFNFSNITSVTIPDSVTEIGAGAFSYCRNLTSITIPSHITTIKAQTFQGCSRLTSFTIPQGVTSIGLNAFFGCTGLTSITIPASVTEIGSNAFSQCTSLTEIIVDSDNQNFLIEGGILYNKNKTKLLSVLFSDITNVTIPDSVTEIGADAFSYCNNLISVTIGNSVTTIGEQAFYNCYGLKSVVISDSVTNIGNWAFYGCSSLTSITIPKGVTTIGINVFGECSSLTKLEVAENNQNFSAEDGILYNKNKSMIISALPSLTDLTIPSDVTVIESNAFSNCTNLTSVTIPSSVNYVGDWAFYNCSSLENITYSGTKEQWNAISVQSKSFSNVKAKVVTCTDGTVTIN